MSAALRIALSSLPFVLSIVWAWRWINDGVAQGAPYIVPSVYGLLVGLWCIVLASAPVILGGLLSVVLAEILRLRPPHVVGIVADRWLTFSGPAIYFAGAWLAWAFMWDVDRPVPTREALYGTSYYWVIAAFAATWSVAFGAAAWHFVTRDVRLTPRAAAVV
ncbi:hypothetical protein [Lysobacter xanthus]